MLCIENTPGKLCYCVKQMCEMAGQSILFFSSVTIIDLYSLKGSFIFANIRLIIDLFRSIKFKTFKEFKGLNDVVELTCKYLD